MANISKAEREARAKEAEQEDGLIEMTKDGETLRVHPSCVESHKSAGWVLKV